MLLKEQHRRYFFERLENPQWVGALADQEFFKHVPDILPDGELVRLPIWPEGDYLVRMAPHVPADVVRAVKQGHPTDNPVVNRAIVQIAGLVPLAFVDDLMPFVEAAASSNYVEYYGMVELPSVVTRLAQGNKIGLAIRLSTILLQVNEGTSTDFGDGWVTLRASARLGPWSFGQAYQRIR